MQGDALTVDPLHAIGYTLAHAVLLHALIIIVVIRSILSRAAALQNRSRRWPITIGWVAVYAMGPTLLIPRWLGVKLQFRLISVVAIPSSIVYGCLLAAFIPDGYGMWLVITATAIILLSGYVTLF